MMMMTFLPAKGIGIQTYVIRIITVLVGASVLAHGREWQRPDGGTVEAELVGVANDQVDLQLPTGGRVRKPFLELSPMDREFVCGWMEQRYMASKEKSGYKIPDVSWTRRGDVRRGSMITGSSRRGNTVTIYETVTGPRDVREEYGWLTMPFYLDSSTLELRWYSRSKIYNSSNKTLETDAKERVTAGPRIKPFPRQLFTADRDQIAILARDTTAELSTGDLQAGAPKTTSILNSWRATAGTGFMLRMRYLVALDSYSGGPSQRPRMGSKAKMESEKMEAEFSGQWGFTLPKDADWPGWLWQPLLDMTRVKAVIPDSFGNIEKNLVIAADATKPAASRQTAWKNAHALLVTLDKTVTPWFASEYLWYYPMEALGMTGGVRGSEEYYGELRNAAGVLFSGRK